MDKLFDVTIVGGGLAGSEAALQASKAGLKVNLIEMRPGVSTGAHLTSDFSELVCSNSFGSDLPDRAPGLLKQELRRLGSFLLKFAEETSVPAGRALAVDRKEFSKLVTENILLSPNISISREEAVSIPEGLTVIASGPLTSLKLSNAISKLTGENSLFFYDAIAPIINIESVDFGKAFRASRYQDDPENLGDYINLPFSKDEYYSFIELLRNAEPINLRYFETEINNGVKTGINEYFEGCLPVEVLANRGVDALAYGPMRPVGLINPHDNSRPFAVIQLRQDNLMGTLYNMVGFQTNLTYNEQERVFRNIPGLEHAEFERYGQMHRNTYIASPRLLHPSLQFRTRPNLFFAGQITGVEGYAGNIASGLLAGLNIVRFLENRPLLIFPQTTMLGALTHYITHADPNNFQPMKANFGILPPLICDKKTGKRERAGLFSDRSLFDLEEYINLIK